MTTRWARVMRGQFVAAFATFTAAFSHGAAGGGHPPLFAVALGVAFSGLACIALSGARLSRLRLGVSIAVSQLFYHGLFSLFGAGGGTGTVSQPHHGPMVFTAGSFTSGSVGSAVPVPASDLWMLLTHLAAAVVTFAVVLHSEQLCAALAALTRLVVRALAWFAPQPTAVRLCTPTGHRTEVTHRSLVVSSSLAHRGPPALPRFA